MEPSQLTGSLLTPRVGWACGTIRRGAAHADQNLRCQDAFHISQGAVSGRAYFCAAVADGHGDSRHDLSDIGAALAVQVATQELIKLRDAHDTPDEPRLRRSFQDDVGRIVTRRWRAAVAEDAAARLETQLLPEAQEMLPVRYGTTLLLSLITEQSVLLGQLGDGDIVWLRADGHFDQPFASSEPAIGTETDSLCSSEATLRWQTTSFDRGQGGTLFLASDGVENCFADERGLQDYLRHVSTSSGLQSSPINSPVGWTSCPLKAVGMTSRWWRSESTTSSRRVDVPPVRIQVLETGFILPRPRETRTTDG